MANSGKSSKKGEKEAEDETLLDERLAALEVATDGIFIVNADSQITYMNNAFFKIINGVDSSDKNDNERKNLFGKSWKEVFSSSDVEAMEEDVIPEFRKEGVWVGSFQIFTQNQTGIWTEMSLTRVSEGGFIGTVQDVSYKKQVEKEKIQLEEQFYQAQKMEAIGRLAGGIAHDFNNILAAMNGFAEFLVDDLEEGSDQHDFAVNILKAGRQARSLVDKMLAFSRRSDFRHDVVDLHKLLEEAVGMIFVSLPKTIETEADIRPLNMLINGNSTQISQMIMNLFVNAKDAIEEEHGSLYVSLDGADMENIDIPDVFREKMPDSKETPYMRIDDVGAGHARMIIGHLAHNQCYAKISIQDSGTGISRVIMEHIFEPFFTTKPVDKGTGLGLSIVHGTLADHCGFMVIDSKLGKGTRFDIYLPLIGDAKENKDILEQCRLQETKDTKKFAGEINKEKELDSKNNKDKKEQKRKPEKKLNILLVEDQKSVQNMAKIMIKRLGHNVSTADNGMEGLDMIRENHGSYDLVITDYNMPKMTGLEMAHQASLDMPDLRFILLSGYSKEKMSGLIEEHSSFRAILRKPVSMEKLEKVIKKVMKP